MLPARVLHQTDATWYGYGPSSDEIQVVTSTHKKGKEPYCAAYLFDGHWEPDTGSYMWDGFVYLTWKRVA